MYLGYIGYKTANVPIVRGVDPPKELFEIDRARSSGSPSTPRTSRRSAASARAGCAARSGATRISRRIYQELEEAEAVHRRLGCPVIEVSGLAIEETARRIIHLVEQRQLAAGDMREKRPCPWYWWPFWMLLPRPGPVRLLRLFTPVWMGIRFVSWLADRRN